MTGFGKVKETLPHKGKFYNYLMDKKTSDKWLWTCSYRLEYI